MAVKTDINDIGNKLCRLETIRRAVAPWQRREIERIAIADRLMADNAQDAIVFGNANQKLLWQATYWRYVHSLYAEAKRLTQSVGDAVEFANVSKEYQDLRQAVGTRRPS